MGCIKLTTIVLALAIVGLPFAATASELPLAKAHKFRTVHHWRVHHAPRVHYGYYYWYRWGWSGAAPGIPGTGPRLRGSDIAARGLTTVKVKVADPSHAPCVLSQTSYGCT
jgi:hypothetical protein